LFEEHSIFEIPLLKINKFCTKLLN